MFSPSFGVYLGWIQMPRTQYFLTVPGPSGVLSAWLGYRGSTQPGYQARVGLVSLCYSGGVSPPSGQPPSL